MNILITGANRGIGLELVRQCLALDCHIIAVCRSESGELKELAAQHSSRIALMPGIDVTRESDLADMTELLKGTTVDVLINNAGIYGQKSAAGTGMEEFGGPAIEDIDPEQWLELFRVNTISPFQVTRALLPNLRQSNHPKVIMVSTMMASITDKDYGGAYQYSSSKTALNMVGKTLHNDLRGEGFAIAMVHPGWVQTDMGGANAETPVVESAQGIRDLAIRLTPTDSGQFFNYDGSSRAW